MKLPRWLMLTMVTSSLLSVLAAAGWWWITWPGTAVRQISLRIDEAKREQCIMQSPTGL
jgi:hypothetical protein